jgi:hypothetical protein
MKVPPFHSVNESEKPVENRVYHNDNTCPLGRDVPPDERVRGPGVGNKLCKVCQQR